MKMKQKIKRTVKLNVAATILFGLFLFVGSLFVVVSPVHADTVGDARDALVRYCNDPSNFDTSGINFSGNGAICVDRGCDAVATYWADWREGTGVKKQGCYNLWNNYVYAVNYPAGFVGPVPSPPRPGDPPLTKLEAPAPVQPPSEEYRKWGPAFSCGGTHYVNACNDFQAQCRQSSESLIRSNNLTRCQTAGYAYGDSINETNTDNPALGSSSGDNNGLGDCEPGDEDCCAGVKTSIIRDGGICDGEGDGVIFGLLRWVLSIMTAGVGIAAVGGIAYGALLYTTAESKPEQTKKAIGVITNVVIGIVAYAVMAIFLNFLIPGGVFNI